MIFFRPNIANVYSEILNGRSKVLNTCSRALNGKLFNGKKIFHQE